MLSRRTFLTLPAGFAASAAMAQSPEADSSDWQFQLPMGLPNRMAGDGVYVMHGYAVENAQYFPGLWHTGENWYALYGDSAGALVYAVAAGEVVYSGFDYPGPVVIIQHAEDLFSQYGHLDYELNVEVGQQVQRGDVIGTVLYREGPRSHLHFELRNFLTIPEVNGEYPRYSFTCGPDCPPGPGYWPMDAPEHPSAMGWRNPLHVIFSRMGISENAQVMVPPDCIEPLYLFSTLDQPLHEASVFMEPGTTLPLLDVYTGPEASEGVGAGATNAWFQVDVPEYGAKWVPAIAPTMHAIQQNGQTCAYVFNLIPVI